MKSLYSYGATAMAAVAFVSIPTITVRAQTPVAIPAAPVVPKNIPFEDEVAGRRLFFAAREAYQSAPAVSFTASWTTTATGAPGSKPAVYTGNETVQLEGGKRRLAVTSETVVPGNRNVRRIISNGESVIATRFDQRDGAQAVRDFVRLPLDQETPLYRALLQVQAVTSSRASTLLFVPTIAPRNTDSLWRGASVQLDGVTGEVVNEVEEANGQRNDTRRMRRYIFDARIPHRLLRFEQWTIQQVPKRPARKNIPADDGLRTTYRREDYKNVSLAAQTFPATTFAQALPPEYKEANLPTVNLPPQPDPNQITPQAAALLKRWKNAHERFLSLAAEIDVTQKAVARAANSRPLPPQFSNSSQHYLVIYRRPGKTRVTLSGATGGDPRDPRALVAASDGVQARVSVDGGRNRRAGRTVDVRDPNNVWGALNQAGFNDRYQTLLYIYTGPPAPDNFDSVTYNGPQALPDGTKADVLTFSRTIENGRGRRNQVTTTVITMNVWLSADGLPSQMETRRVTTISGAIDRDQPPSITILSRFRSLRVDTEPPVNAFTLPSS